MVSFSVLYKYDVQVHVHVYQKMYFQYLSVTMQDSVQDALV